MIMVVKKNNKIKKIEKIKKKTLGLLEESKISIIHLEQNLRQQEAKPCSND